MVLLRASLWRRAAFLLGAAALVWAVGLAYARDARSDESISILEYDDQGRVIGLRRVDPGALEHGRSARSDRTRTSPSQNAEPTEDPAAGLARRGQRIIEGEVLVANLPRGFEESVRDMGFRVLERVRLAGLGIEAVRLALPRSMTVLQALRALRERFPQVTADVNAVFDPSAAASAPASLAREAVSWTQVEARCGSHVRVGIIDGVVDTHHPALAGARVTYRSFHREGWTPAAAEHGTAIAAMLVGVPAEQGFGGVLPGATLFAGNVFGRSPNGLVGGDAVAILRALEWMIEMKVHVVNMSFAGGDHKLLRLAIEKARTHGIVAVASVGNWGSDTRPAFPAALADVISVTAVTRDMRIYGQANTGDYVDFAAPGVHIWTAVPEGGKFQNGTSFATPFISALVGAAVANGAAPDPATLRENLGRSVLDLGVPGRDRIFGYGFVIGEPNCFARR